MPETAFPISTQRLEEIANAACEQAVGTAEKYQHEEAAQWNQAIINSILQSLISETSSDSTPPQYKYVVNSTTIQHQISQEGVTGGRRGMHSAVGAYWNTEKDGMWSHKWEGAEKRGMDVVISVTWIGL
ncbi:dynein light chain, cytosolic [Delitschia confertaspora ATCC 74209]|uniref:Dynein light chain, cytosolic n=1 Tax=Delitschia confertaspora ATCC 74209 TaxID=1513339 RepID=A0A9P4JRY6_9PLEO|nr:dynein light chain, cytosolic [Delitschia confertaspora ATCC 74209]